MRATLLGWLGAAQLPGADPHLADLHPRHALPLGGRRLLDAGCGTGALSIAAARAGASVTAVDLSATLVALARERLPCDIEAGRIDFRVGDMLETGEGRFDHAVLMDSLIHYRADDVVRALSRLADRVDRSILFTFAPRTKALTVMHALGQVFPRGNRSPAIEPVGERHLRELIAIAPALRGWRCHRSHRVATGFYISQALEIVRS